MDKRNLLMKYGHIHRERFSWKITDRRWISDQRADHYPMESRSYICHNCLCRVICSALLFSFSQIKSHFYSTITSLCCNAFLTLIHVLNVHRNQLIVEFIPKKISGFSQAIVWMHLSIQGEYFWIFLNDKKWWRKCEMVIFCLKFEKIGKNELSWWKSIWIESRNGDWKILKMNQWKEQQSRINGKRINE
jgi:hypothetical protein